MVAPNDTSMISVTLSAPSLGKYVVRWVAVTSDERRTHGDFAFKMK
ncbi:copper resistance protein CopC [Burkholderia diffusa]|nr:copper resistance protein CopC [Burkholderia diffusa]